MPGCDWQFYSEVYKGRLTEGDFSRLAPAAEGFLSFAAPRIKDVDGEKINLCVCALCDELYILGETGHLKGEKAGEVSADYRDAGFDGCYRAAALYLGAENIYRGV